MASGHGVLKPDQGGNPNRQPKLSQHWRPSEGTTGPMGAQTFRMDEDDSGSSLAAWSGPQGYHGEVHTPGARYVIGPLRTQNRAMLAAEAAEERNKAGGDMSRYERG